MCNCRDKVKQELIRLYPQAESVAMPYEILSDRSFSECEIYLPGKKKPIAISLLHSFCPHCGEKYEISS